MATYATGVGFVFAGSTFTVTNVTFTLGNTGGGADQIDATHLGLTTGASVISLPRPLLGTPGGDTGKTVSIEYLGTAPIAQNSSGTLTLTGPFTTVTGNATCNSSSITLAVNDIIRGTAEFQLA
jgi:hypothetical protein